MGGGGSPDTQTVVQKQEPWGDSAKWALEDLNKKVANDWTNHIWGRMATEAGQGHDPYSVFYWDSNRVAPMSQDQTAAMDLTRGLVQNAGSYIDPSYYTLMNLMSNQGTGMPQIEETWNSLVRPTIMGDYLDPAKNTALQGYVQAAQRPLIENYLTNTLPTWNQDAVMAGRYGSGAWQEGLSQAESNLNRALGDVASGIYAPAYESERNRQMSASTYAPSIYEMLAGVQTGAISPFMDVMNQGFKGAGYLSALGEAQQQHEQNLINAAMQQWQDMIYGPMDFANTLANYYMTGGSQGRTTTTIPYSGPTLGQTLLGTGMSGVGLYQMLKESGLF